MASRCSSCALSSYEDWSHPNPPPMSAGLDPREVHGLDTPALPQSVCFDAFSHSVVTTCTMARKASNSSWTVPPPAALARLILPPT